MPRLQSFPVQDLTQEQRAVYELVPRSAARTEVHGPVLAMLLEPELATRTEHISLFFKKSKRFERRLRELAILVTARSWTCHYEWYAHAGAAVEHGLSPDVVEAIRMGQEPHFDRDDEEIVYSVTKAIQDEKSLPDDLYERARTTFTEAGVTELLAITGYYTYLAMLIAGFELEPPHQVPNPLPVLAT